MKKSTSLKFKPLPVTGKKKIKSDSVSKKQLQKFDQLEKELEKAKLHILDLKNSNKKLRSEIGKNYSPQLKGTLKKFKKE